MRFSRMRSRVSSSGAWRRTSSSKVAFASSIIAHSSPPWVSIPAFANRAGSTWRSSFPSSGSPSESASRFAGSIVRTTTFLPRAAIPVAIAAELVVFPTPPEPAQMQTRLRSSSSATLAISPSVDGLGQLADLLDVERRRKDERERSDGRGDQLREASELLALRCGAAALAERGTVRPAKGPVGVAARLREPLNLVRREAFRVEPVHVHAVDRDVDLLGQLALERHGLVDGHLL